MTNYSKALMVGLPVMLVGKPGVGKTSSLRACAEQHGRKIVDLRVAMMPPEDLVGIPHKDDIGSCFSYLPPEWAQHSKANKGGDLLIVLEEIHLAPPSMHAALYNLLQEKEVAGVDLSCAWVAATANPPEYAGAAIAAELPEALKDRLEIFEYDVEGGSHEWLLDLARDLKIDDSIIGLCGLYNNDLPVTPRSCERLLRLIAAGYKDGEIIARRSGNIYERLTAFLQGDLEEEESILVKTATKSRVKKNCLFTKEGFLE